MNSMRYSSQKIFAEMRRPKNISEIRKEPVIIKFFRDFINNRKNRAAVLAADLF